MANVRFELNEQGVSELMLSDEMDKVVYARAKQIQSSAQRYGGKYGISKPYGKKRVHRNVYTEDFEAVKANSEHDALLRAIGGG